MMNNQDKSIVLLSGGLDSLVSLGYAKEKYNITLALTFDYGQRCVEQEIEASKKISEYYKIEHKLIQLPWLTEITDTCLVNKDKDLPELNICELDEKEPTEQSAKHVWVPNRNGVFINIAGSFADSMGFKYIIFGANREEAVTFPDNSEDFIREINKSLEYSTRVKAQVIAPLAKYDKKESVKIALDNYIPLDFVRSCYTDEDKHCGRCESCLRLKRALTETEHVEFPVEFME